MKYPVKNQSKHQLSREEHIEALEEKIHETRNALWRYIKRGEKNKLLENLESDSDNYRRKLKLKLDADKLLEMIVEDDKPAVKNKCVFTSIKKAQVQQYLDDVFADTQYYTLASLSKVETRQRLKEQRFTRIRKENQYIDAVIEFVYKNPYTELSKISRELKVESFLIRKTIDNCEYLFNIRYYDEKTEFISLSSDGYLFVDLRSPEYNKKQVDEMVYTSSMELLDCLQSGGIYTLRIDDRNNQYLFSKKYSLVQHKISKNRRMINNERENYETDYDLRYWEFPEPEGEMICL